MKAAKEVKLGSSRLHSTCTLFQVTHDLLTVEIPDRAFFKTISRHDF